MTILEEWPEFGPDPTIKADVTSGILTLISPSKLENYANYDLSAPNIRGTVIKNGTRQGPITINSSTGVLSMTSLAVSTGDHIVFEFRYIGRVSLPWMTRVTISRLAFFDVPANNSQTTFSSVTNAMPVPSYDIAFGWTAGNNLKGGVKVTNADGSAQNPTLYTRLMGTCPDEEASTTVSLSDTTNAQTNTSTFDKADMARDSEIEWFQKSGAGSTRQEERVRITWAQRDDVPTYPTSFPSSGTQLKQMKVNGGLKLYRP